MPQAPPPRAVPPAAQPCPQTPFRSVNAREGRVPVMRLARGAAGGRTWRRPGWIAGGGAGPAPPRSGGGRLTPDSRRDDAAPPDRTPADGLRTFDVLARPPAGAVAQARNPPARPPRRPRPRGTAGPAPAGRRGRAGVPLRPPRARPCSRSRSTSARSAPPARGRRSDDHPVSATVRGDLRRPPGICPASSRTAAAPPSRRSRSGTRSPTGSAVASGRSTRREPSAPRWRPAPRRRTAAWRRPRSRDWPASGSRWRSSAKPPPPR